MADTEQFRFGFERMDVYRVAREFLQWVHRSLLPRVPRGHAEERDHLRRASLSILLNVGEGAQQESKGLKRKHFRIAKGSAGECAAVLDALAVVGVWRRTGAPSRCHALQTVSISGSLLQAAPLLSGKLLIFTFTARG